MITPNYNPVDKVVVIGTGGTISSSYRCKNGVKPVYSIEQMLEEIKEEKSVLNDENYIREIVPIDLMSIDSSNMQPEDWQQIAKSIYNVLDLKNGEKPSQRARVVLTHGTDTMAYTASAISFMVQNLGVPVIFTGSQQEWDREGTDARSNLYFAIRAATEEIGGVCVAFEKRLIRGTRAKKTEFPEDAELDPFKPAHVDLDGEYDRELDRVFAYSYAKSRYNVNEKPTLDPDIDPGSVKLIRITPGMRLEEFDSLSEQGYKGVVIEAYGQGNMPINNGRNIIPKLEKLRDEGVLVTVGTQTGGIVNMDVYEVGREPLKRGEVAPLYDMTVETAYTKLMWIFGHTKNMKEAREMLLKDYAGEIDINNHGVGIDTDKITQNSIHDLSKGLSRLSNRLANRQL